MRNTGTINPTPVAELFDGEREQFLVEREAEVNLSGLDVFPAQMLTLYATYSENRNRQVENRLLKQVSK